MRIKGLLLILAAGGVAALLASARATARPLTPLDRINPAMNFAYVRVTGVVLSAQHETRDDGYLSFVLREPSGARDLDIRVIAYRNVVRDLSAGGPLPQPGDHADVQGTLRFRDDGVTLVLNAARELSLIRPEAEPIDLAALDALPEGARARTQGQLRRWRAIGAGTLALELRDGESTAQALIATVDGQPPVAVGAWIEAVGAVGRYRERAQLLIEAENVRRIDAPWRAAPSNQAQALDTSWLGRWVTVDGELIEQRPFKSGTRLIVRLSGAEADADSDIDIDVVVFDSVWAHVPVSQTLHAGQVLRVSGEVAEFHGRLELLPEIGDDVRAAE